jgi:hypothetical protein
MKNYFLYTFAIAPLSGSSLASTVALEIRGFAHGNGQPLGSTIAGPPANSFYIIRVSYDATLSPTETSADGAAWRNLGFSTLEIDGRLWESTNLTLISWLPSQDVLGQAVFHLASQPSYSFTTAFQFDTVPKIDPSALPSTTNEWDFSQATSFSFSSIDVSYGFVSGNSDLVDVRVYQIPEANCLFLGTGGFIMWGLCFRSKLSRRGR